MVESTQEQRDDRTLLGVGSVQNCCLLTADKDVKSDPEDDWTQLAPVQFTKPADTQCDFDIR